MSALLEQHGGSHYLDMVIQPIEFIHANRLGYDEGTAVVYLSRWKSKGGIADLQKAKHHIELLLEFIGSVTRLEGERPRAIVHMDEKISAGEYISANRIDDLEAAAIKSLVSWNYREDLERAISSINTLMLKELELEL